MVRFDAASGEYWFNVPMQGVTTIRAALSMYSRVPEDKLILEVQDVGGGFGQRSPAYPEYVAMMLAARATGKPIKWVSSRVESFLTDNHGRATLIDGQLAMDRDGRFLAMRFDWISDFGAYLAPGPQGHIRNTATCMTGVYKIPALYANFKVPLTNTTPVGAYRGAGRPDVAIAIVAFGPGIHLLGTQPTRPISAEHRQRIRGMDHQMTNSRQPNYFGLSLSVPTTGTSSGGSDAPRGLFPLPPRP